MTITIYGNKTCTYCDWIKYILDVYTKDIVSEPITGLIDTEYSKVPVIKINNTYITNYTNLKDLLDQINQTGFLKDPITLKSLYNHLVEKIYLIEEDDDESINYILKMLKITDIVEYSVGGFQIPHHIICSQNNTLIKNFIKQNIFNLNIYKTSNHFLTSSSFIKTSVPGNQTLLHVSAQSNKEVYLKLRNVIKDSPDDIGFFAKDYYEYNNVDLIVKINKLMQEKYGINYNFENIIDDELNDENIKHKIIQLISKKQLVRPNSMHEYGIILEDEPVINELIQMCNKKFNLGLENKIYQTYVFTAEYHKDTNKKLDIHKDSSTITINWNLEVSDDLIGTELVFPYFNNKTIRSKQNQILIHHGMIDHYVTQLESGYRKNLIIWIR